MVWTAVGTAITPSNQWQFTAPIEGEFFRLKHTRSPSEPKAWICQAEKLEDGSYQIFDTQQVYASNPTESFQLKKPAIFVDRCIGFRYKTDYKSSWMIALEVSNIFTPSVGTTMPSPTKTYYLKDSFTGIDGEILTNHKMDLGGGWSTSDSNWKILNNKAVSGNATGLGTIVLSDSQHSDISVEASINWSNQNVNSQQGLVLRAVDNQNYLLIRYVFLTNNFRITQTINGNQTDLASGSTTISNGLTNLLKFTASGSSLKAFLDNQQVISINSDALIDATKCGLWSYEQSSGFAASWEDFMLLQ